MVYDLKSNLNHIIIINQLLRTYPHGEGGDGQKSSSKQPQDIYKAILKTTTGSDKFFFQISVASNKKPCYFLILDK